MFVHYFGSLFVLRKLQKTTSMLRRTFCTIPDTSSSTFFCVVEVKADVSYPFLRNLSSHTRKIHDCIPEQEIRHNGLPELVSPDDENNN